MPCYVRYLLPLILFFGLIGSPPLATAASPLCHKQVMFAPHAVEHIKFRHWPSSQQQTSKFLASITVKKLKGMIHKVLCKGKKGKANQPSYIVKEYTFKKPIGRSTQGKKVWTMRVVTNARHEVVTAFPIE
jgi:hypothetical protein